MLGNLKRTMRTVMLSGLLVLGAGTSHLLAQNGSKAHTGSTGEDTVAFFKEFPMALVYRGVALFADDNFAGAINAFERYLDLTGRDADTATVNSLLREAWVREYPLSLVYDGYGRYFTDDVAGALRSWERYIKLAPEGADTADIRTLIVSVQGPAEGWAKAPGVIGRSEKSESDVKSSGKAGNQVKASHADRVTPK